MDSVKQYHPGWEYHLWAESNIGSLGLDMHTLMARCVGVVSAADVIRCQAVFVWGGIYLDIDVECLKSLEPLRQYPAFAAKQQDGRVCNAFFGAEPGHPWIRWQLDRLLDPHTRIIPPMGVLTMTEAPRQDGNPVLLDTHLVYPFNWDTPPDQCHPHPDSLVVHHWEKSWGPHYSP